MCTEREVLIHLDETELDGLGNSDDEENSQVDRNKQEKFHKWMCWI
jgi:hypothetical protein